MTEVINFFGLECFSLRERPILNLSILQMYVSYSETI